MARTRIKFCGITRPEDAAEAARLGADAIGLVFHRASARAVTVEQGREIVAALPPFVAVVGLFLDAARDDVEAVLAAVPLDALQFHGRELDGFCSDFGRRYIKALGMAEDPDVGAFAAEYPNAAGILVDGHAHGAAGGTGAGFAWERIPRQRDFALVLAGGLSADNVAEAVRRVRPDAVDVSSGVESTKGLKDVDRMRAFIEEVQRGDREAGNEG